MAFGHFKAQAQRHSQQSGRKQHMERTPHVIVCFRSRLARSLPSNRHFDSAAEVERQRGETRRWIIVLARQVLDGRVKLKVPVKTIAAADVDLLVGRGQVAVRKKHGGSKR